ncbi:MAG: 30S ribosomal protein S15 [Patescibacteria group bacterium]
MLKKTVKKSIIHDFKKHETDSGSVEVQIGLLTKQIKELTEHLKKHKHDFSSRRGLLRKVSRRRQLLKYLQRTNPKSYEAVVKKIKQ